MTEDFNMLADEYYARVYYHAFGLCKNAWDAADVTQNTFLRACLYFKSLRDPQAFGGWIFRICDNEIKSFYRKKEIIPPETVLRQDTELDESAELRFAVEKMDEKYRVPVLLKYYAGFSMKEISVLCNIPVNLVKSRLRNGRQILKSSGAGEFGSRPRERRNYIMEKLKKIYSGSAIIPKMSNRAQKELMRLSENNEKFSEEILKELSRIKGGAEWVAECNSVLRYGEFVKIVAACDEGTLFRLIQDDYGPWGARKKAKLLEDVSELTNTGGYVESVEFIMYVPSIINTVEWYRKHLGWDGDSSQCDEDYGYSQLRVYSEDVASNYCRRSFKGIHLWKGEPSGGQCFCFVVGLEKLRARILESGWEKVSEIHDRGWGTSGFDCFDLNGFRLLFCEWNEA